MYYAIKKIENNKEVETTVYDAEYKSLEAMYSIMDNEGAKFVNDADNFTIHNEATNTKYIQFLWSR